MSDQWPTVRLRDYIDSSLGKMLDQKKNKGTPHPYLGNSNVRWGHFDLLDLSEMRFENSEHERYGVKKGDLIVCEGGEPGRCAIWDEKIPNMKIQKALHRIRTLPGLNCEYLYLCFLHWGKTRKLDPYFTGTTIKHLTGKALAELPLELPPEDYQLRCAKIIMGLERKIKLNTQINQTLESIAQAIFKSWFVDFEPVKAKMDAKERWYAMQPTSESASPVCYADEAALPDLETYTNLAAMCAISGKSETELAQLQQQNPDQYQQLAETAALFPSAMVDSELGEIPEGWKVSEIGNEVEIVGGGTPSTSEPAFWDDGEIHWTTPKDLSNNKSKVLLDTERKITEAGLSKISSGLLPKNTVLMSSRAPVGYLALAKVPVAINQGYIGMKCIFGLSPEFIILWAESVMEEIQQRASGTTFAEISKKTFRSIPLVKPAQEVVNQFTFRVGVIFDQIASNEMQARTLIEIRDGLLPRLLSGEISLGAE